MAQQKLTLPRGTKIPNHIAMILDGNRRWARSHGLHPSEGHREGAKAIYAAAKAARDLGIHTVTVWAFSTENWERDQEEQNKIWGLVTHYLKEVEKEAKKDQIRFVHIGRKDRLPKNVIQAITKLETTTKDYTSHLLNLALDYGGLDEILRATKKIVTDKIPVEKIDKKLFESYLDTGDQPYPYVDLFIRTSGEQRTSGLMPWQMEYAEYYFEHCHLPDFTPEKLKEAILDYSRRRRRFGANDAVEHFTFKPELAAKLEVKWWRLRKIPQGVSFTDYTINHLKEQYGMSKELSGKAAKYMLEALADGDKSKWGKAGKNLHKFYKLLKEELKIAFEPKLVASLEIKLWQDLKDKDSMNNIGNAESTAQELYAESYRLSLFQAAKLAHLRVLANVEKNMAEKGMGEHHWDKAEDYLNKFYVALKDRVA